MQLLFISFWFECCGAKLYKPKEDQLNISYKKVSTNGFIDKRDIDGLSSAAILYLVISNKQKN